MDWYGLLCYDKNSTKQLIWLIENDKIVILALNQVIWQLLSLQENTEVEIIWSYLS